MSHVIMTSHSLGSDLISTIWSRVPFARSVLTFIVTVQDIPMASYDIWETFRPFGSLERNAGYFTICQ